MLTLDGDAELLDAARAHQDYIAGETLATGSATSRWTAEPVMIDGRPLKIGVTLARQPGSS